MTEKTLGQIGFEAYQKWNGYARIWGDLPQREQLPWQAAAQAIAQAVAPLPEVGGER